MTFVKSINVCGIVDIIIWKIFSTKNVVFCFFFKQSGSFQETKQIGFSVSKDLCFHSSEIYQRKKNTNRRKTLKSFCWARSIRFPFVDNLTILFCLCEYVEKCLESILIRARSFLS